MSPTSIVKAIGGPGSIGFLALSCSVGILLAYAWPKRSAIGRSWLLGTLLLYGVLAFPFVAHSLAESLPPVRSTNLTSVGTLDELILLSGDNEDGRVAETLDAWRTVKPDLILVLGDEVLAQRLAAAGIPATHIRQNDVPASTRAQMEWVAAQMRARPVHAVGVIASRLQMPRVIELARMNALNLLFLSSPLDYNVPTSGVWSVVPSYRALELSRDALYERAAFGYYRSRGWIQAEP